MIEPRSVVHFSIAVSDLDASQKFYTEILGLTLVQAAPANGMVFLRAGNDHVILAKSDAPLHRDAKDSRRAHEPFMKLKLVAAISALAIPALAHAQQSGPQPTVPKPTKADAQNVVQIITSDKVKTQAYCDLTKLEGSGRSGCPKERCQDA